MYMYASRHLLPSEATVGIRVLHVKRSRLLGLVLTNGSVPFGFLGPSRENAEDKCKIVSLAALLLFNKH